LLDSLLQEIIRKRMVLGIFKHDLLVNADD